MSMLKHIRSYSLRNEFQHNIFWFLQRLKYGYLRQVAFIQQKRIIVRYIR